MKSSRSRSRSKSNRSRSNSNHGGNVINRVFDSSGPEGKVRGTPQQIIEKYNQLARDAQLSNDRVAAENFQQHAEHYTRLLSDAQREMESRREEQERQNRERQAERDRERAERQEREAAQNAAQNAEQASAEAVPAGEGDQPDVESTLVETPESQPKPKPKRSSRRKPRAKPAPQDGGEDTAAPDDSSHAPQDPPEAAE